MNNKKKNLFDYQRVLYITSQYLCQEDISLTGDTARSSTTAIAVQAGEEKIHPVIGKDDRQKTNNGYPGDPFPGPASDKTGMQGNGIHKPGNQRPGFLGIPAPVSAPGGIRPHRTGNDTGTQPEETENDGLVDNIVNILEGGQSSGFP